jgi:formylglycine-generating enzyme required for sulfatase activity
MPNWYGLFDLHGGLWEWTESQQAGLGQTAFVYRGGAFYSPAVRCRCAQRNYGSPDIADSYRGLRLVLEFLE